MDEVLAVVSPHVGGRRVGATIAEALQSLARVTVVEDWAEDPAALRRARVILTGLAPVSSDAIEAAEALELIQCASHGFDYVDLDAAARRSVTVANIGSTDAEKQNVAEQTFALMLALAKQLVPAHEALSTGDWALPRLQSAITELSQKTLGIIGFGHIGREVARRAAAFDMHVLYTDRRPVADPGDAEFSSLDALLARSDYVTVHAPLAPDTTHLIGADQLRSMKPTAFLINTARGAIVDQSALAAALSSGTIAGAGIDVFDPEPPHADFPLLTAPNVVLSPHVAGVTRETLVRIAQAAIANAARFLRGEQPLDVVGGAT
jgi:phosphoglycerate dehydrogenase-like enzyme